MQRLLLGAVMFGLALVGCGGGGGDAPTATIIVRNNMQSPIYYLHLIEYEAPELGENLLVDGPLGPGDTFTIPGIVEGRYFGVAKNEEGFDVDYLRAYLSPGEIKEWYIWGTSGATATLNVHNDTSSTEIVYLYLKEYGAPGVGWGNNILTEVIPPGGTYTISDIEAYKYYDMRAETWDNVEMGTYYGVPFEAGQVRDWYIHDDGGMSMGTPWGSDTVLTVKSPWPISR